jgi:hypothetical protein
MAPVFFFEFCEGRENPLHYLDVFRAVPHKVADLPSLRDFFPAVADP